jgi:hypothetical protein
VVCRDLDNAYGYAYITLILLISITGSSLDFKFNISPHDHIPSPPEQPHFIAPTQRLTAIEPMRPDIPGVLDVSTSAEPKRNIEPERGAFPGASIAVRGRGDRLCMSGGLDLVSSDVAVSHVGRILEVLHKSSEDVFLVNKITARCSSCGLIIPRFEGYRHIRVGEKKTYCRDCQVKMGLPVRAVEVGDL